MIDRASLVAERELLKKKLGAIETLLDEGGTAVKKRGALSAETRRKISLAAKARWKAQKAKVGK
jgi:hypothetical protein